ncbi:MAG: alanine--tRNA ligase-related protein [Lachnospiraceae bacterium]|nr:alanine--tRNA ligase-related protein [Lachnospiraceae bacterium]
MTDATEKLYYQDSHMREFTAQVLSCEWDEKKNAYGVVLDRTAFFPEGGGQYADSGVLGGIAVEDVKEKDERVLHYLKQPLEAGAQVQGVIDYEERFSKMQQHSGEHIVSGLVHRYFGYDNVGFHLGQELVTMDFNGTFTGEQLCQIEREANAAVTQNIPIQVIYPTRQELDELDYRSKKELSGQVRIVIVPGYDVCACCAPHVSLTGEIGMIRLVDAIKYKGGTRVTMVCGFRALQDYRMKERNIIEISRQLSVKPYETAEAVQRMQTELQQWKEKLIRTQTAYLEKKLEELSAETKDYILFEPEMDKNAARKFVDAGMQKCSGICGIFLGNDESGYQYTLGSQSVDLKTFLKEFHETFPGKGGGKSQMVQGTVAGAAGGPQCAGGGLCDAIRSYLCK